MLPERRQHRHLEAKDETQRRPRPSASGRGRRKPRTEEQSRRPRGVVFRTMRQQRTPRAPSRARAATARSAFARRPRRSSVTPPINPTCSQFRRARSNRSWYATSRPCAAAARRPRAAVASQSSRTGIVTTAGDASGPSEPSIGRPEGRAASAPAATSDCLRQSPRTATGQYRSARERRDQRRDQVRRVRVGNAAGLRVGAEIEVARQALGLRRDGRHGVEDDPPDRGTHAVPCRSRRRRGRTPVEVRPGTVPNELMQSTQRRAPTRGAERAQRAEIVEHPGRGLAVRRTRARRAAPAGSGSARSPVEPPRGSPQAKRRTSSAPGGLRRAACAARRSPNSPLTRPPTRGR